MKILPQLVSFRQCVMQHLNEIGDKKTHDLHLLSIVEDSQTIWGGLGDREKMLVLSITTNGWDGHYYTQESGQFQKGDGISDSRHVSLSDITVQGIINGDQIDYYSVKYIFKLMEDMKKMYPQEMKSF